MTVKQAEAIRNEFGRKDNPTEDEFFEFTEAMGFLIEKNKNPGDMMYLGGVYYELKKFDLALKYYELAATYEYEEAFSCLGYIWYYGRTGERDYKKAFECFSRSADLGNLQSEYKVADMYKNGYYVERDYEKYKDIIRALYPKVKNARFLNEPLPEIYTRMARIYTEEGRIDEAIKLYYVAKDFLSQRLRYNAFFGDLNIMKWLIDDLYLLTELDDTVIDFYDLFHLLKNPCTVAFRYKNSSYTVKALEEDGQCVITFDGKWFRTRDDFFSRAVIGSRRMTAVCHDFYMFEVSR